MRSRLPQVLRLPTPSCPLLQFFYGFDVTKHMALLHQKYDHYFFAINSYQYDWIRNSSSVDAEISTQKLSLAIKENFLELRNDRTLRLKFRDITVDEFWIAVGKEYRQISEKALKFFSSSAPHICVNKVFRRWC